ncbi:uncharacterized protein LOC143180260 [Calliopsis andreniformis]|uniref:uncharacterized protein LOC143180260 n=1 Tax=Calliopsis andreniformis TaxID=337506 RepID=UPI003FCCF52C
MRLSTVVELLLILLLIAFAAYGRVIDPNPSEERAIRNSASGSKQTNVGISTLSLKQAADSVNRYCTCNENICNCCRDFHIPLVQLQGPGCASLQYLQGDNLAVQLSFGDNILTSTIVSGRNPKPVCVPLPGGFTKFCGRIYSIQRDVKNHFKACLGLELQSATELEASLRVSCFRFGPDGLKLRPAEPLPVIEQEVQEDDDDEDFFGLGSDEDDDDDDDSAGNATLNNSVPNSSTEEDEDDDDEDVLGFGALLDIITGEEETSTKKPKVTTAAPLLQFTIPILTKPTSVSPLESYDVSTAENNAAAVDEEDNEDIQSSGAEEEENTENDGDEFTATDTTVNEAEEIVTEASNKIASFAKPAKVPTKKLSVQEASKKKPTVTGSSINAIESEVNKKKKPLRKPVKGDDDVDILADDLVDDDDEDDEILEDDDDDEKENDEEEDEDEDEKEHEAEDEDEKAEEVEDLDDDDDEAEDAVISALVYDEKEGGKKRKVKKNDQANDSDDDDDYGLGLTGLLARSRHSRSGRQSKVMRF